MGRLHAGQSAEVLESSHQGSMCGGREEVSYLACTFLLNTILISVSGRSHDILWCIVGDRDVRMCAIKLLCARIWSLTCIYEFHFD